MTEGHVLALRRLAVVAVILAACGLSACGYVPTPPDPIRYVTSPSEVTLCRRLGSVGIARTDGEGPAPFGLLGVAITTTPPGERIGREIVGRTFASRLDVMRDEALALGATDLLLSRRV